MLNRRQMIGGTVGGFFAFAARNQFANVFAQPPTGIAKRCVVLWMEGGPSQLDTFDPKSGTLNGGPTESIATASPEIQIASTLPNVAKQMQNLSVIRNLTSNEGEHLRAKYYMHTGFKFVPSFPRPAIGSVVAHSTPKSDIPKYVSLGQTGIGPAYMGPENAPFVIEDPEQARLLFQKIRKRTRRIELLQELDSTFSGAHDDPRLKHRRATIHQIERMATTPFATALDIANVGTKDHERYGVSDFGRRCLIARQLLQTGVNFVEIHQNGWDTHENNFRNVNRLCGMIDQPFAALVQDLKSLGLFEETLIVWMGEFGRTPGINARVGRDHYPTVTPVVMGGGPVNCGITIGKTDKIGNKIIGKKYQVADLFATMLHTFGISPDHEFTTDFDSPTTATDSGKLIAELV